MQIEETLPCLVSFSYCAYLIMSENTNESKLVRSRSLSHCC